jgi:hypothetical protein
MVLTCKLQVQKVSLHRQLMPISSNKFCRKIEYKHFFKVSADRKTEITLLEENVFNSYFLKSKMFSDKSPGAVLTPSKLTNNLIS